jgi:hypothetical protein
MTQVIIGFSAPKSWKIGAEVIKLWQGRTQYCHVYLLVYSQFTKQWLVYHASHGMVHCLTYDNFKVKNEIIKEFSVFVAKSDFQATIKRAQQMLSQPYGYLGLIKLALRRLGLPVIGDNYRTSHCSEFIATLFPTLAAECSIDPDFIEPVHLHQILESFNG